MFKSFLVMMLILSNLSVSWATEENDSLHALLSQQDEKSVKEFRAGVKRPMPESMDLLDVSYLNKILAINPERSVFIPLELNNQELITLAAATSLGVVAFANDQEISKTIQKNQTDVANKITDVGNFYGYSTFAYVAAGSYFMGVVMEDNKLKQVGIFIIAAELAQALVTESAKNLIGRDRPSSGNDPYHFFGQGKSFWSGHTATAFTLATVLSEEFKDEYPVVPYIAYGLAALTAYARVHGNNHWASDVITAAVMGHLVAKLTLSFFKKDGKRGGIKIYPAADISNNGIRLYFEWVPKTSKYIFH